MNKTNDIAVDKQPILNPTFPEFGENVPSRTSFLRAAENVTKETELSSGDRIARFMTVHWSNANKKVGFKFDENTGEFNFTLPTQIGDYFSISWAINDTVLTEYSENKIISFGFNNYEFGKRPNKSMKFFGALTLIKGKKKEKQTVAAGYYENRLQSSFNMIDQKDLWNTATRGWMDFIVTKPRFGNLKLTKPMIWVQSKMTL